MVLLLVSLGRTIKTMISNTYIVVSSKGTAMAGWRVESRHFRAEKASSQPALNHSGFLPAPHTRTVSGPH